MSEHPTDTQVCPSCRAAILGCADGVFGCSSCGWSEEDIALCRRCGSEAKPDTAHSYGRAVGFRVFCLDCDNHGPLSETKDFAVAGWNKEQVK